MFIESLLNQGEVPLLEQTVRFAAARHRLLAENVANASTPGYQQKDLSLTKFQEMLSQRLDERASESGGSVEFTDVSGEIENPSSNILFHDRNNRSMEQLMTDGVKNALYHNTMMELLRRQFSTIETALKERVG
ncbi:MAG: flagellar basal body rod protein FlgB [Tepidisphaeraceae bacterium]